MKITKFAAAALVAASLAAGAVGVVDPAGASVTSVSSAATTTTAPDAASATTAKGHAGARRAGGEEAKHLRRQIVRKAVKVSATAIGITPRDLVAQLKDGRSIAEVATAHDVDPQTVIGALVNAATGRIDTAMKNGKIRERAAKLTSRLPTLAERIINRHHQAK